ncbi:MAG TPA: BON domain-containing protein [Rhodanobacteraceae bacterium]|jgi:osmotically-inducible protein OsmY|nr:BON domain-containing protein [Rhodanobacteraceae bacterium]
MKNVRHQPKVLAIGIALVLGFTVLGAGCSQDHDNNGTAVPSTARTTAPAPMPPQRTNGAQGNNGVQSAGTVQNGDNGYMAGSGNSQSPVSDTWITTKVRAKLHTIDGLDNSDISVETNNGTVTLSGRVASQDQLNTVVSAVKTIKGVNSVDTSNLKTGADTNQ